jgi:outer membrane PBP1 activator LpoA protein
MKIGDQPWLLKDSTKKNEIVQVLPKANGDTLRCFALGYDSLNLALGLSNLIGNNNEMISGLSGNIYIDRDGNTHRDLLWETIGSK